MAILKDLNDVNALLQKKGLAPVEAVSEFRLTPTQEELQAYEKETKGQDELTPQVHPDQLFIQHTIEDVIQHYKLDHVPGFYGEEEHLNAAQIRQGVIYQVLNQPQILFEFFKKRCYDEQKMDQLNDFNRYYQLAVTDAKAMYQG